ncbi:L,D-peptidoglycan transpeptidase YkuD, ErfK/YbiS/YcfS/YnhG family [Tistlia consotensis]|uniref:L,D-peptidoglycan transpeptidase YkuD, ErfK/YbiS/YcfS/YnhG family n=1 Tax=Tistlia consotensis USBA 355 TaxID=560819 RepID=A0A1Y6BLF6_9PROT|nr:L,D-transpeptidase family protein [Tistlia consotensis]SMF09245.1 L,D-peptidoglycan transpeptidase YkuD, ErfK/YbiS/YcfS/YnhG family [Tistlia consotensis USBA 355]SNR34735.1 L,D-peptidoglycan transpeptidase YkuD, ErfK/YbiS/YcfS/YnhG family [Tistlia consotensis]
MDLLVGPDSDDGGRWQACWNGRRFRCAVGRGGLIAAATKREGDGATPLGRWPLRRLLYRPDRERPDAAWRLPSLAIAPGDGWCDDPGHPDYNRAVALPFPAGHERLWRDDSLYDLVVVLGHNDSPPEPGLGSAIFLHCARPDWRPTEGCVALAPEDLRSLLREVGPEDAVLVTDLLPPQG